MNRFRDEFFASSRFARDQHRRIYGCHLRQPAAFLLAAFQTTPLFLSRPDACLPTQGR
jgi:hypothetical protein